MISTYQLKSHWQRLLRPTAAWLYVKGVTANQITVGACLMSLLLGSLALWHPERNYLFLLISFWCLLRMAANALDGMLARDYGQATRLGAVLNETGDLISDAALYLPFALIAGTHPWLVVAVVLLALLSEFAGVLSVALGGERACHGPMGKSDRALVFGVVALMAGCGMPVAGFINEVWMVTILLLALTIINRARAAASARKDPTP